LIMERDEDFRRNDRDDSRFFSKKNILKVRRRNYIFTVTDY
jgi:hypothetical protein